MKNLVFAFILIFMLFPSAESRAQGSKTLSDSQIETAIKKSMDTCHVTAMSVVLVKGDKIIYQNALGLKNRETKEKVEIDDIYRIASISKSFSAAAIMQLVEEGKISLEDDVNDYLPFEVRNPRHPEIPITIKHFLTHTSSMRDNGVMKYWVDDHYINPAKTTRDSIAMMFKEYAPGWGFSYCNRAYNMMGNIIEKASGERFDDYIRNHILLPMGIINAGFNLDSVDNSKLVEIYKYDKSNNTYSNKSGRYKNVNGPKIADSTYRLGVDGCYWQPTAGMKISAPDLAKWMMTIRDNGMAPNGTRIFSERSAKIMKTPYTPDPTNDHPYYCLGLYITPYHLDGITLLGHTGSLFGLRSYMFYDRHSDWGVVCICSSNDGRTGYEKNGKKSKMATCYRDVIRMLYRQYFDELTATEEN